MPVGFSFVYLSFKENNLFKREKKRIQTCDKAVFSSFSKLL